MMNVTRMSGLASGIDTDSIVKKLMDAQRVPVDNMQRRKTSLSWKEDAYRTANLAFNKFKSTVADLQLQGGFLVKTAESSNAGMVSAKPTGQSRNTTYQVEVTQLADSAKLSSGQLGDGTNLMQLTDKINTSGHDIDIQINGKNLTVTSDMTVQGFQDAVNGMAGTNVKAYYSDLTGNFQFQTTNTGENSAKINIDAVQNADGTTNTDSANFISNVLKMTTTSAVGKSAIVSIDGVGMKEENNTFSYDGTNFTVSSITDKPVTITIKPDVDGIMDKIHKFVSAYNDMIQQLNGTIREKKDPNYQPLTDSEKSQMSDTQVSQWETKAKTGILNGDSLIQSALTGMRNDLSNPVSGGDFSMLSQIGITTGQGFGAYAENGKLYIDDNKLRNAIESNPDGVANLFAKDGQNGTQGIAKRLTDRLDKVMVAIANEAGGPGSTVTQSMLDKQVKDLDTQINTTNDKLNTMENRYYSQFSAMEKAMAQYNSQSGWLAQQLGMGQSSH